MVSGDRPRMYRLVWLSLCWWLPTLDVLERAVVVSRLSAVSGGDVEPVATVAVVAPVAAAGLPAGIFRQPG